MPRQRYHIGDQALVTKVDGEDSLICTVVGIHYNENNRPIGYSVSNLAPRAEDIFAHPKEIIQRIMPASLNDIMRCARFQHDSRAKN